MINGSDPYARYLAPLSVRLFVSRFGLSDGRALLRTFAIYAAREFKTSLLTDGRHAMPNESAAA
ncbi:hypothetical protein AA0535_2298 [Asaia krungthepensis NRIC 0535]|uniref:Uncharacterized protein n=1 Tax=Asaia krungthepensis NRIC 0535 TaxID=1307925 RepID=A0ABQ0Q4V5_9PROT|nr:hypothetical protein AA0535_2298 [Asaia krungthepensis NRIC 0535]